VIEQGRPKPSGGECRRQTARPQDDATMDYETTD
jgi:hypothetical protein